MNGRKMRWRALVVLGIAMAGLLTPREPASAATQLCSSGACVSNCSDEYTLWFQCTEAWTKPNCVPVGCEVGGEGCPGAYVLCNPQ